MLGCGVHVHMAAGIPGPTVLGIVVGEHRARAVVVGTGLVGECCGRGFKALRCAVDVQGDLDVQKHPVVEPNRLSAVGRRRNAVADD